jgi:RING-variant domain/FHA domain
VCRICYCDESELDSPLLNPCNCSGGVKYIHLQCLQQWLKTKSVLKNVSNSACITYTLKQIECELCKAILPDALKHENQVYDIWDFIKPNFKNYLVLESCNELQATKTIYMLNFDEKSSLKLGRSNESDIKISDISVSRFHCTFKLWEDGEISILDNKSKFGTLIHLNHPYMPIYYRVLLTIQVGRSLLRLHLKNPCCFIKLITCWKPKEIIKDYCELNSEYIAKDEILNIKIQADKDSLQISEKSLKVYNNFLELNDERTKNNLKKSEGEIQSRIECNTSHNQGLSPVEEERKIQLPVINNVNLNTIHSKDFSSQNFLTKDVDLLQELNIAKKSYFKNNYIINNEVNNVSIAGNIDPNYIGLNLNYEDLEKLKKFQILKDYMNRSNSISNFNKIYESNHNLYVKKRSLNFDNNINLNGSLHEIEFYNNKDPSSKYNLVSPIFNKKKRKMSYQRRKNSRIKSPICFMNKMFDEDNLKTPNMNTYLNHRKNIDVNPPELNLNSIIYNRSIKSPNEI